MVITEHVSEVVWTKALVACCRAEAWWATESSCIKCNVEWRSPGGTLATVRDTGTTDWRVTHSTSNDGPPSKRLTLSFCSFWLKLISICPTTPLLQSQYITGYIMMTQTNDRTYRIIHIGLCLSSLIFCQTKSDSQHRFTNHPRQLFFSDM